MSGMFSDFAEILQTNSWIVQSRAVSSRLMDLRWKKRYTEKLFLRFTVQITVLSL